MTPEDIGKILDEAAGRAFPPSVDASATERAKGVILKDLHRVNPLAPAWALTLTFLAIFAAVSAAVAALLGMHGLPVLNGMQRAVIFTALLGASWLAAAACVREMSPAAGQRLSAIALALAVAGFPVVFSIIFRDYNTQDLVKEGIPCLEAGLLVALPTGLLIAWILRRGFVLRWTSAGMAAGVLSGLAGLGMLELHCVNLKAIHVMIWHVAVVLVSGVLGLGMGRIADALRSDTVR